MNVRPNTANKKRKVETNPELNIRPLSSRRFDYSSKVCLFIK